MYVIKTMTVFGAWYELEYHGVKGAGATFNKALVNLFTQMDEG